MFLFGSVRTMLALYPIIILSLLSLCTVMKNKGVIEKNSIGRFLLFFFFVVSWLMLKKSGPVFSYKLRYIVGFWLVEMAISTNQKPTIYRNLYENTDPGNISKGSALPFLWRLVAQLLFLGGSAAWLVPT